MRNLNGLNVNKIAKCFKVTPTCNPKISIVFNEKMMKKLIKESIKRKRSVAYIVRQAVDQYYEYKLEKLK